MYAYVSESMKPGTLCSNETLRKLFLTHITDTMQFFGRPENETIGDSNQFLRYNFCVTVKSVAQDLRGQEDRISNVRATTECLWRCHFGSHMCAGSPKAGVHLLAALDNWRGATPGGRHQADSGARTVAERLTVP